MSTVLNELKPRDRHIRRALSTDLPKSNALDTEKIEKIHKAHFVVLTYDSPTKPRFLPQATCHQEHIAHTRGNAMIHSSQTRCHWLHYPAPSHGHLRVPGCTDVHHELRQYREAHLAVGPTIQALLKFRISFKGGKSRTSCRFARICASPI